MDHLIDGKLFRISNKTNTPSAAPKSKNGVAFFDPVTKKISYTNTHEETESDDDFYQAIKNSQESAAYQYCTELFVWWQTGQHPYLEKNEMPFEMLVDLQYLIMRYNQTRQMRFWENWGKILGGGKKGRK